MIDRSNFRRLKSCYDMPRVKEEIQDQSSTDFEPDPWQAEHSPQPRTFPCWSRATVFFILDHRTKHSDSPCANQ